MTIPADQPGDVRSALAEALADRYALGPEAGRGAMSHVFQARDLRHDRSVAIKVLRPELSSTLGSERFLREIRVAARLQHAHIVPLFDSGDADGLLYFVMPLLEGESLRERLAREGALPVADALRIARDVADALVHAHASGVIHRDVKPANILLSGGHSLLGDFGLAQAVAVGRDIERITSAGLAVGTPEYMSPEQAFGEGVIDGRADVYSLGCVLYEMLVGEPPFRGRTAQVVLQRHLRDAPTSLRTLRPLVSPALDALLQRALRKLPADRFQDAGQLRDAIDEALLRLTVEQRIGVLPRWMPRPRFLVTSMLIIAVLVAGILALGSWDRVSLDPNRVLVFPLRDRARLGDTEHEGEGVATYLGYALEETAPLRWLEATSILTGSDAAQADRLSLRTAREAARRARAAYFIDGALVRDPDSLRVVLRLYSAASDSLVRRVGASGLPNASAPQLGIRAIAQLLPMLLAPGRRFDLSVFERRNPVAITHFLRGEAEYRSERGPQSLAHYQQAVAHDSAFALAALKGSLAARWLDKHAEEASLLRLATAHRKSLPGRYGDLALGMEHQHAGRADSAIAALRRAIAADTMWVDAWMALGEVFAHLVPNEESPDSQARAAFERAHSMDPDNAAIQYHLVDSDLARGDTARLHALVRERAAAQDEAEAYRPYWLASNCLKSGWSLRDWMRYEAVESNFVLLAGHVLARHVAHARCASGAAESVMRNSTNPLSRRWGALLTFFGLLVATGDTARERGLLAYADTLGVRSWSLLLLRHTAFPDTTNRTDSVAAARLAASDTLSAYARWLLAEWAASRGRIRETADLARGLRAMADASDRAADSVLADVAAALVSVAQGDSARAIAALGAVVVRGSYQDVVWQPWTSLGSVRLRLARLLLARGRASEAIRIASQLDALEPAPYVLYYVPSLELRESAARQLADEALLRTVQRKLRAIRGSTRQS